MGPNFEANSPGLYDRLNANEALLADDPTMQTNLTQLNDLYHIGCTACAEYSG